jgi:ribosomal protein L21E
MSKFQEGDRVIIIETPTEIPDYKKKNYVGEIVTVTSIANDERSINIRLDDGNRWGVYIYRVELFTDNYFEVDL